MTEPLTPASTPSAEADQPTIEGPTGEPIPARQVVLGIEKIRDPGHKHYRLICIRHGTVAWLCREDQTEYRRKADAVEAGRALATDLGAAYFSEVTR